MDQALELQKRINKQIPVTDCIAYVTENTLPTEGLLDMKPAEYMVSFDFIRHKQKIQKPLWTLNLSNGAVTRLILTVANDLKSELQRKIDIDSQ